MNRWRATWCEGAGSGEGGTLGLVQVEQVGNNSGVCVCDSFLSLCACVFRFF